MRDTILNELRKIQSQENVKIIMAIESGSRAWGFASPDSDYDVRFIYVRKEEHTPQWDELNELFLRMMKNL